MNKPVALWILVSVTSFLAGCAQQPVGPSRSAQRNEMATIAQIGYGPTAKYVTCPIGGCAQPTRKTIADENEKEQALTSPAPAQVAAAPMQGPAVAPAAAPVVAPPASVPVAVRTPDLAAQPRAALPAPMAEPVAAPTARPAPALVAPPAAAPLFAPVIAPQPLPAAPPTALAKAAPVAKPNPEYVETIASSGRQRVFIGFPTGSARLTKEAQSKLRELAPKVLGAEKVVIKGRTDERGNSDSNDRLALRRAMAVYEYLRRTAHATATPFKLLAKGACCYIARNITEDGRAANRRAEIDFVVPMQASAAPTVRPVSKGEPS